MSGGYRGLTSRRAGAEPCDANVILLGLVRSRCRLRRTADANTLTSASHLPELYVHQLVDLEARPSFVNQFHGQSVPLSGVVAESRPPRLVVADAEVVLLAVIGVEKHAGATPPESMLTVPDRSSTVSA